MDSIYAPASVRGRVCAVPVINGIWRFDLAPDRRKNLVLYEWSAIAQKLLRGTPDGKNYKIGAMYIEFDNSGGSITAPTPDRSSAHSYYENLNSQNADRDYLRVPIIATEEYNSDSDTFDLPNAARFYAQTAGTTGVHGNSFSDVSGSVVYGGALVSTPQYSDSSQDLIFSRFYFAQSEQVPKTAASQIGLTWDIELE